MGKLVFYLNLSRSIPMVVKPYIIQFDHYGDDAITTTTILEPRDKKSLLSVSGPTECAFTNNSFIYSR